MFAQTWTKRYEKRKEPFGGIYSPKEKEEPQGSMKVDRRILRECEGLCSQFAVKDLIYRILNEEKRKFRTVPSGSKRTVYNLFK